MDGSEAKKPKRRLSLTKKQLETKLGAELLAICQQVTADGKLTQDEVARIRQWLDGASDADMPAVEVLRDAITEVLADGELSDEDLGYVHAAVETVMPAPARKVAEQARKELWAEEERQNAPIRRANFMVAGIEHEGRPEIIRQHCKEGDRAYLIRDRGNRFSRHAIAIVLEGGQRIGFVPERAPERYSGDPLVPLAPELARLMDQGAEVEACITKVLTHGEHPIPIVEAHFFKPKADARTPKVAAEVVEMQARSRPSAALWVGGLLLIVLLVLVARFATT